MTYGESIYIFNLSQAQIHFVENEGMAFGLTLGGNYGKLALSLFRIIAVGFLGYYLTHLIKMKASKGLLISFSLILAGALGNIIDSAFYGLIFSESYYHGDVATIFPSEGGYAPFLHGKVVDMLYFPLFRGTFPSWFPFWGGDPFLFFKPVFNIADSAITIGVFIILLFQRKFFAQHEESPDKESVQAEEKAAEENHPTEMTTDTSAEEGGQEQPA